MLDGMAARRSRRGPAVVLAVAIGLAAGMRSAGHMRGAMPAQASPGVAAPLTVAGSTGLRGIACPGDTCYAVGTVGDLGVIAVIPPAGLPSTEIIAGATALNAIDCLDSSACYAVGFGGAADQQTGVLVTIANGGLPALQTVAGSAELRGIACGSGACVAVGTSAGAGVVISIPSAGVPALTAVTGTVALNAIICPSATCYAVGEGRPPDAPLRGVLMTVPAGGVPTVQAIAGTRYLNGIACPTDTCYAVGEQIGHGALATLFRGAPATTQTIPTGALAGIACPAGGACFAVSATAGDPPIGAIVSIPMGGPPIAQTVGGTRSLSGVACATTGACYAVGDSGEEAGRVGVVVPVVNGDAIGSS